MRSIDPHGALTIKGIFAGERWERRSQQRILFLRRRLAWDTTLATASKPQLPLADRWNYLLTPRGEVVELPKGATPLDFATAIHTEIGHRCIGAKVDGRIIPLTDCLQLGEQVTILTQKTDQPRRDWFSPHDGFVTTRRARVKIRTWLDQQGRLQGVHDNRDPLNNRVLIRTAHSERVGSRVPVVPGSLISPQQNTLLAGVSAAAQVRKVKVAGVDNLLVTFARCCHPTLEYRMSGFMTRCRGISFHREGCHRLSDLQGRMPERLISVQWCNGMLHSNTT